MDNLTPEQRRKNMQAIKNRDSQIELLLRRELWKRGLRYRKNVKTVYGHPDIAFIGKKVAVFCDSEFWHGYDWEHRKKDFKSNKDFCLHCTPTTMTLFLLNLGFFSFISINKNSLASFI